jgi:hypothetical protein
MIPETKLQLRPDLALVSFERWLRSRRIPKAPAWDVVPNLAIEVVSPSNSAYEVLGKIEDYFRCGVERVWVIYPTVSKLYDYDSPVSVSILTRDQTLSGGAVLPGLHLPLAELFENEDVGEDTLQMNQPGVGNQASSPVISPGDSICRIVWRPSIRATRRAMSQRRLYHRRPCALPRRRRSISSVGIGWNVTELATSSRSSGNSQRS